MKLESLAIIDCEWAPSCQLNGRSLAVGSVDLIEWAVINMDLDPIKGWLETGRAQGLVHYPATLPKRLQKLTGIDPYELQKARPFDEWAETIQLYTKARVLVGHHIEQDYQVLQEHFARLGIEFRRETFCTLKEAKKQWPALASYELNELARLFDLPHEQHHRAHSDALVAWKLFEKWHRPLPTNPSTDFALKKNDQNFPWLSHHSRELLAQLTNTAGIISFYSHKKLLHIKDCLDLKKEAFQELQKLHESEHPLTHIKISTHPHLMINRLLTLETIAKYSPPLSLVQLQYPDAHAISCYKNKAGLLTLKVVRYKKAAHHRFIDYAENKKEALLLVKKIEDQFNSIANFHYIDPEELSKLIAQANKQRQSVINKWKTRFCEEYQFAQKTLSWRANGDFMIQEVSAQGPANRFIKAQLYHHLQLRKIRHQFQKLATSHWQHDGHSHCAQQL